MYLTSCKPDHMTVNNCGIFILFGNLYRIDYLFTIEQITHISIVLW